MQQMGPREFSERKKTKITSPAQLAPNGHCYQANMHSLIS